MRLTSYEHHLLGCIEHRKTYMAGAATNACLEFLIDSGLIRRDLTEATDQGKDFLTMAIELEDGYYGWQ